jgi:hypothetical protein
MSSICEKCGKEVHIGDWPYCPHEYAVGFGEEPIEPYVDEHVASGGTDIGYDSLGNPYFGHLITTRAQRRRLMERGGLDYRDKPKDKAVGGHRIFVDLGRGR